MQNIVDEVRRELAENADEKVRVSTQRFFKEAVVTYGVKSAVVAAIAKRAFTRIKCRPKKEIFTLCEEFWRSGRLEEGGVACAWAYGMRKQYLPEDFPVFERWVDDYLDNWASCDTLCTHTLGAFIERYPEFVESLKSWTRSPNRWKKRAAAVSLVMPARKGLFLADILEIAECLLADSDDLVQKGYGWMLKVASQTHRSEVFAYLVSRKDVMPRTAFRYALEKMPPEWRALAGVRRQETGDR
jgi:3-methyladenine DNA glycosylase AlkD